MRCDTLVPSTSATRCAQGGNGSAVLAAAIEGSHALGGDARQVRGEEAGAADQVRADGGCVDGVHRSHPTLATAPVQLELGRPAAG